MAFLSSIRSFFRSLGRASGHRASPPPYPLTYEEWDLIQQESAEQKQEMAKALGMTVTQDGLAVQEWERGC